MKHLFLLILMITIMSNAFAQHWQLQPTIGAGFTNTLGANPFADKSNITTSYDAGIGLERNFDKWQLASGISYFKTGYLLPDFPFYIFGNSYGITNKTVRFSHIGIPIMAGHRYDLGKRLRFIPFVGLMATYNFHYTEHYADVDIIMDAEDYHRFSLFGLAQARFSYKISPAVSIIGGPVFRGMITSFLKQQFTVHEREYSLTIDVGASFRIN